MSNYLSLIKCTWVPTRETKSGEYNKATHLWTLDFIYNNKKFITDNNLGNPGLIQSNTSGIRLKQNDNSEKYIIEYVKGLSRDEYGVMYHEFMNRSKDSPLLVIIEKRLNNV